MQEQLEEIVSTGVSYGGHYNVETFVLRGDTIPAVSNNTSRWKSVRIDRKDWFSIEYMDGAVISHPLESDTTQQTLKIIMAPRYFYYFKCHPIDSTRILWRGLMGTDSLKVVVQKKPVPHFLLVKRGFHWINEYPLNQ